MTAYYNSTVLTEGTHYTKSLTKDGQAVTMVRDAGSYTVTLTAKSGSGYSGTWTKTFTVNPIVTFNANGRGTAPDAQAVTYGGNATEPDAPTVDGYDFGGWYTTATCTGSSYDFSTAVNSNLTLYAKWTVHNYTITYNLDGGTNATGNPGNYTIESAYITLGSPSKTGYDFGGWYDNSGLTGDAVTTIAAGSTGDKTLYAQWKKLLTNADITIAVIANQEYTGSAIEPTVTVSDGTADITGQCEIAYSGNTATGTATVTITAKSESTAYSGSTSATFAIVAKTVTNENIVNTGTTPTLTLKQDQNGTTATLAGASDGSISIAADVAVDDVVLSRSFNSGQKTAICWPFMVTATEAAALGTFYEFKGINTEGRIEMQAVTTDLAANTPYIFEPSSNIAASIDFGAKTLVAGGPAQVGSGYTYKGIYSRVKWTTDITDPLYDADRAAELGKAYGFALKDITVGTTAYTKGQFVKLGSGAHSRAFRAYLLYDGSWDGNQPSAEARRRSAAGSQPDVIDIVWLSAGGQTTGITEMTDPTILPPGGCQPPVWRGASWYSMDGRRLSDKPATKGVYINNGKKVIIK